MSASDRELPTTKRDAEDAPIVNQRRQRKGFGGRVVLVVLVTFFAWAAFFPLSKGVVAPGVVVVDSKRKTAQHPDGGVIKMIHVKDGDRVAKGAVLLELDDTKARAERDVIRSRYFSKLANSDRLRALSSNQRSIDFSPDLVESKEEPNVKQLMEMQLASFSVQKREQDGKTFIARQRIGQLQEKIKGLTGYKSSTEAQIEILSKEISRLKGLLEQKLVESSIYSDRLQQLSVHQGALGKTISEMSETQVAVGEANLALLQVDREWQQRLSLELSETTDVLIELRSQLISAEAVLDRAVVKAPADGVILGSKVTTVGGVIAAGAPIMDIVPEGDMLVVESRVSPIDVDSIHPKMGAFVKFTSFVAKTTPNLNGTVTSISADVLADPAGNTPPYYLMKTTVSGEELTKLSGMQVLPGMPAEIYIDGGSRTLLQYLIEPISSLVKKSLREE